MLQIIFTFLMFSLALLSCKGPQVELSFDPVLHFPQEKRLKNIRQLTWGGTNAEAYWSYDGKWLVFQHKGAGLATRSGKPDPECDQIYKMSVDGKKVERISNGLGRTTCSYFFPDDSRILFSSTHAYEAQCPTPPDMSRGYVWPIYPIYHFFSVKPDGSDLIPAEPGAPRGYHAEAVTCKDGSVVFTSDRDGDLELYRATLDKMGTFHSVKRLTHHVGYDGGATFSLDCTQIVWRASRPRPGKELKDYQSLLKQHLVRPTRLEIWVANADGSGARQVTQIGAASFAPTFTPDGKQILFSSNPRDSKGRMFDLYLVNVDGTRLEQVTFSNTFDSFPMFSPDGKYLAFSSNRNAKLLRETNVFIAEWLPR